LEFRNDLTARSIILLFAKAANKGKGKEKQAAPARGKKSTAAAVGGRETPADSNSQAHAATAKTSRSLRRVRECCLVRGKKPKMPSLESCKDDPSKLEAGRLQVFGDPLKYFAICRPPWDLSDADEIRAFNCETWVQPASVVTLQKVTQVIHLSFLAGD